MVITVSKYTKIKETRNGRFCLRLRAETGTDEYVKAYMRANDGAKPPREELDQFTRWQNLFVMSDERKPLEKLMNKLRFGKKHSLVARTSRPLQTWNGVHTDEETGEIIESSSENLTTGIEYLELLDSDTRLFAPALVLLK